MTWSATRVTTYCVCQKSLPKAAILGRRGTRRAATKAHMRCEDRSIRADVRLLSSWHSRQTALKCSYRSDRVTRDWPVALRVRAAQTGTRKGLDGPQHFFGVAVPACGLATGALLRAVLGRDATFACAARSSTHVCIVLSRVCIHPCGDEKRDRLKAGQHLNTKQPAACFAFSRLQYLALQYSRGAILTCSAQSTSADSGSVC